jgi:hypothetical protein
MSSSRRFILCLMVVVALMMVMAITGNAQEGRPQGHALLVGIDTYKHYPQLPTPGAEEDAHDTRKLLMEKYGFLDGEIMLLLGQKATAQNIRDGFNQWLIQGTRPGDRVCFFYSGHGTTVADSNGDEARRTPGDTKDEALAPYDVGDSPDSIIIDDELEVMINQLSGRMAVLVFDSCNSGTISRGLRADERNQQPMRVKYLPSPDEIKAAATRSGGRSLVDADGVLRPQGARGLNVMVDKDSIRAGGIVVLSASQPEQDAYSITIRPDYCRGAFSYLLNRYLQDPHTTLRQLKSLFGDGMQELHQRNLLNPQHRQDPYFETFSAVPLDDQPLFGAALTAPAVAMANPVSPIKLRLRTLDGQTAYSFGMDHGHEYHETVAYEVETDTAGYLYLIVFSEGDVATRIFPNETERNNRVEAGKRKIFREASGQEGFIIQEPAGKDRIIALLCSSKLNFGQVDDYRKEQYTWKEVFDLLNSKRFSEQVMLTRGQSAKGQSRLPSLDMTNWQSVSIVVEAKKVNR